MSERFVLRLYNGEAYRELTDCMGFCLEQDAYTPYAFLSALFCAEESDSGQAERIALYDDGVCIFDGIPDSLNICRRRGATQLRIRSRSFTAALVQNQLAPGLHPNLTMETLMTGFYPLHRIGYEAYPGSGYIYVKEGDNLWDSIVNFSYKLSGRYPYVHGNTVRITPHAEPLQIQLSPDAVTAWGQEQILTNIVSHYHMADTSGNPEAYTLQETDAGEIVRHKYLSLDRQYLYEPMQALYFRQKFASRYRNTVYLEYAGYHGEGIYDHISCGDLLPECPILKIRTVFGKTGLKTHLTTLPAGVPAANRRK